MALGGGLFLTQNKVLPGHYMNFVSKARASANIKDRGFVGLPMCLNWGVDEKVFTVENAEFQKDSMKIFGYSYDADEMKNFRELFLNAQIVNFYRLNSGEKASNTYGTAKYSGTRGNDIKLVIQTNVDEPTKFDVITYLGTVKVDAQLVTTASELKDNDYVVFKKDATLEATPGIAMTGGTNKADITGADHQTALAKLEAYSHNVLICTAVDETIMKLYAVYVERLRDEVGVKLQTVVHGLAGDYPGVINVKNTVSDEGAVGNELVYWVGGAEAACPINKTISNQTYDGEYTIEAEYTQTELEKAVLAGEFVFHKVGTEIRVLEDINSFVSFTEEMNKSFSKNQVIRVLDQYGNDIAAMFNDKYNGNMQNDEDGRISFWGDLDEYNKKMQKLRAVQNYNPEELIVEAGEEADSVVVHNTVQPTMAMAKCYMTVYVN